MKSYDYKIAWCPICNQGWVEIVKEKGTDKLFVCCSECESEWDSPDSIDEKKSATCNKYGFAEEPNCDEIVRIDWLKYVI